MQLQRPHVVVAAVADVGGGGSRAQTLGGGRVEELRHQPASVHLDLGLGVGLLADELLSHAIGAVLVAPLGVPGQGAEL